MMHDIVQSAKTLLERMTVVAQQLNITGMRARLAALEQEMTLPEFWQDPPHAQTVSKEVKDLQQELDIWHKLQEELTTLLELATETSAEQDASFAAEITEKFTQAQRQFNELEFHILLNGKYDTVSALVGIHAGAGGVDAQDWAEMLLRMILRYCEQRNFSVRTVHVSRGNEAGIKSAMLEVAGRYAYGYLKSEHGVHRLVRQSPFNADALRQTSFALIEVLPDLGEASPVTIKDEDIRIDVYRAGGHGGQGVNTTDSAVRITHLATGIVVTCQNERSQHQNKASAMKILKAKLHKKQLETEQVEKLKLRGEYTSAEWGNQIRSYVLHPYKLVKDHRTDYEETEPQKVLDGNLNGFVESYLRNNIIFFNYGIHKHIKTSVSGY
ncbi:MAG: peptide chain release factor 2 [Patescibacteria group bacterium]|jgi:peptide chain release factor 2